MVLNKEQEAQFKGTYGYHGALRNAVFEKNGQVLYLIPIERNYKFLK